MNSSPNEGDLVLSHGLKAMLQVHPGVREFGIAPRRDAQGGAWLIYVVPNDVQLELLFNNTEEERKRVKLWRKTYDLTQLTKDAKSSEPGFNIAGWNSAYTRLPIPAQHMREWVELTVKKISALKPSRVLEIGCGTGMLLLRLARNCQSYVAVDFAPAVLQRVREQMTAIGGAWDAVTLLERAADNFEGLAEHSFDTVIINSVTQHFPNRSYLLNVVKNSVRVLRPGGRIFVGDNRNLALLEPFALSVELFQAPSGMTAGELRERHRRRILLEDQLVLSPAFFTAVQKHCPEITCVSLEPKLGRFDTEMNRYRFDATLFCDVEPRKALEVSWMDWTTQGFTMGSLDDLIRAQKPETLALRNIPNSRLEKDLATLSLLANANDTTSVEELKAPLGSLKISGIDPSDLASLAEKLAYRLDISWAAARPDGSFDAVFRRAAQTGWEPVEIRWPHPSFPLGDSSSLSNAPGQAIRREQLLQQLSEACRIQFPETTPPLELLIVDELPRDLAPAV